MLYCNQASCLRCITWDLPLQTLLSLEVLYTPLPQRKESGTCCGVGTKSRQAVSDGGMEAKGEAGDRGVYVCESMHPFDCLKGEWAGSNFLRQLFWPWYALWCLHTGRGQT